MKYIGALDQGTTSTRFVIVDETGSFCAASQIEHEQIFPKPGWVEHDPLEIWSNTETVVTNALDKMGISAAQLSAVGITNQRETTMIWDKTSGEPLANAIVWQDTRTDQLVKELGGRIGPDRFRSETGLPLATYFAGPKARWLLDEHHAMERAEAGDLLLGTMDTWIIWKLTGEHVTDVTNASRTLLMNLATLDWDDELLDAIGIPAAMLPEIRPSIGHFGTARGVLAGVPILGVLGDQQAAMFGQAAFNRGNAKNTYGTGCFMLLNTGTARITSEHGLLTTVAYQWGNKAPSYALEGSIAIAGAGVQWLRDNLGIIDSAPEVEALALRAADNGGVYFVPAFSGLFAPYWRSDARGIIAGLTGHSDSSHIARATLEAVAYQSRDVLQAMEADAGVTLDSLKVDGGMVANELLMQFQADILGVPVVRPVVTETTVLGAAYAAGLESGIWEDFGEVSMQWAEDRRFEPSMENEQRDELYGSWQKAVERTFGWLD